MGVDKENKFWEHQLIDMQLGHITDKKYLSTIRNMAEPWEVVVVGSCMIDLVSYAPRLPKPGETLRGSKFDIAFGGKGCNQCVSAKKLGAKTLMIARLGDDSFGKDYIQQLKKLDIPTDYVKITKNVSSGTAQITVADNGENQIVIVLGANNTVTLDDVKDAEEHIKNCKVLVAQLEITLECSLKALEIKRKCGKGKSILNGAPAMANLNPLFFTLPDIFCVNESEAELIIGLKVTTMDEAKIAVKELISRGCREVILTLGEQGALYSSAANPKIIHVPAEKVVPVDTTGAGDAFIGALAFTYAKYPDMKIEDKIKKACKVAAMSVQKEGTQKSFATLEEAGI